MSSYPVLILLMFLHWAFPLYPSLVVEQENLEIGCFFGIPEIAADMLVLA